MRREEDFADIVIDSIPGVFYVLDSQGRFVRWNHLLEEVTGLTAEMLFGTDALATIFADDRQLVAGKIQEVFEKGQAEVEARLLGKDGLREFWFTGRRMDVGPTAYLVGSGVDIADRKRNEQAVFQLNEQRLIATERERAAQEMARNLEIQTVLREILHDSQEPITLQKFLERSLERLVGVSWIALESRAAIFLMDGSPGVLNMKAQRGMTQPVLNKCRHVQLGTCLCGRAAMTRQIVFASHVDERHDATYPGIAPHGHYCVPMVCAAETVGVISFYLPEGHVWNADEDSFLGGVAGVLAGVIRRKQDEDALREREQRYRELLAAVTNYTYSVKLENGVPVSTDHSPGCLAVTGSTPEDYQFDPYLWIKMVHPDDQDAVRQYVAAILSGDKVPPIEHRIIRRDGTLRWLRHAIVPHHDGGMLVRYDGLVEDVTARRSAEDALREREMQLQAARRIQEHLLPDGPPTLPGFDIAGATYPADFAAGDYFDFLPMHDGLLGFVVADVSGHGIGPAMVTASTQAYLRSLAEVHTEVDQILKLANVILCREMKDHLFVTLLLARLDPATRSFVYASAGHPTGYIIGSSGEVKARLESTGIPLGIMSDAVFPASDPMTLEPGDVVLLLTDGLQEARSPEDSAFGTERAVDVVRNNRDRTADEIVGIVHRALQAFSRRNVPLDDVTVVVIKVQPAR